MSEIVTVTILYLTSFFTLINPLGVMPVFMTMTSELTEQQRKKIAKKAVIVSFFTLIAFAFTGQLLFKFFGISINSFRIVGGIIFLLVGFDMLQARLGKIKVSDNEIKKYSNDISITPLAIPMICGPGAITNAIVLMDDSKTLIFKGILIASIAIISIITYLILWSAAKITNFLGETGNNVLMRLMGLIVMVIAIEFLFSGLKPILRDIFLING